MIPAIRFSENIEQREDDEERTSAKLRAALSEIMSITQRNYQHAVRGVHAKSHALLTGKLKVKSDLPIELAQGLFRRPGEYAVILRFSTIPGDILPDSISVPRGLAIKVLDAGGPRLEADADTAQDFVFGNAPAFAAANAGEFLKNLQMLAKTTDRGEWAKRAASTVLRRIEKGLEAVGSKSALLTTLGGHPLTHPAGDTYYSQTPFRYGDYVAKFQLAPISRNLTLLTGQEFDLRQRDDAWRDEMKKTFAVGGGVWEFRVQLWTDSATMPVEDSSAPWPENKSAFLPVATLSVEPQSAWSVERSAVGDDKLAFSPWTGMAAHRPLGSINRVRREAYQMSSAARAQFNQCPMIKPRSDFSLPT